MADNIDVDPGTGVNKKAVATDEVGGFHYQRVKIGVGAEGAAADLAFGASAAASSLPVTQSTEDAAKVGALTETAPATDTASSGLNGRLQRVAQRLTSLMALLPAALGSSAAASSLAITASTEDVARVGIITETAPATDTASSGLNGRLQRIAQRLTSLIALVPASLGAKAAASSFAVTSSTEDAALQGALTETAPATDTASSGLNGRLQRLAQRMTSLIALLPTSLGSKAAASSLAVTQSTEDAAQLGSLTETAPATDTASSGLNGRLQRIAQRISSFIALIPTALSTGGAFKVAVTDGTTGAALDYTIPALVGGDVAHGTAVGSSKPIVIAGRGATANPTANADGNVTRIMTDKLGKVIAVAAVRDLKGMQSTTITASTSETTIVTAVASTFLDLYGLILTNSSASATVVTIKDSTAGTTRAVIEVPAGDTRGFMLGAGEALPQATVNTAWTATSSVSVTSLFVSAYYVKNI